MDLSLLHNAPDTSCRLVVAVSGGPDSMALLHLLVESGYRDLVVAHLDHQLRAESQEEAKLVRQQADLLGLTFELCQLDVRTLAQTEQDNLEAVARRERYRFFRTLRETHQAELIVTAHHADDQVETVLMNIIRGCGLEGLGGMRQRDRDLWRPLLDCSKDKLLNLCQEGNWPYVLDESNDDLRYRRNALRHQVIPHLKQLNPNLLMTMSGNIHLWQQAADELLQRAEDYLQDGLEHRRFPLAAFLTLSEVEQQLTLRALYQHVHGHKRDLMQDHLQQILRILRNGVSGKQKEFGPGKILVRERESFVVRDVLA